MIKEIILVSLLLFITDCVTIPVGKIGYLVPSEKDTDIVPKEIISEHCPVILINVLDNLNTSLRNQGVTNQKDVTVVFEQGFFTNCLQIRK